MLGKEGWKTGHEVGKSKNKQQCMETNQTHMNQLEAMKTNGNLCLSLTTSNSVMKGFSCATESYKHLARHSEKLKEEIW